ncbi:MAG: phosphoglucosamine mutase [Candidatus Woesearchaeota archaeon]
MIFGTDGIRGKPLEYPLTPEILYKLGQVLVKNSKKVRLVLGQDTRKSCNLLSDPLCEGISDAGGEILDAGIIPTPAVAYLTRHHGASGGIMITASHNPFSDNGIKLFNPMGEKLTKHEETLLEEALDSANYIDSYESTPSIKPLQNDPYLESLSGFDLSGMHVVIDCANGAASFLAQTLLQKTGAKVSVINDSPDGTNINEGCGALYPKKVSAYINGHHADYGVSLDGDCDRSVFVDEKGNIIDGDTLLWLNAIYLKETQGLNAIVATEYSNKALDDNLSTKGIKVIREKCGDRNVYYRMKEDDLLFGGENSGHLIYRNYGTTGDGLLSTLMIARIIKYYQKPLSDLVSSFKPYPQLLRNYTVERKPPMVSLLKTQRHITDVERKINGRVLVRYSGTEPKVRILVESPSETDLASYAESIHNTMEAEICRQ